MGSIFMSSISTDCICQYENFLVDLNGEIIGLRFLCRSPSKITQSIYIDIPLMYWKDQHPYYSIKEFVLDACRECREFTYDVNLFKRESLICVFNNFPYFSHGITIEDDFTSERDDVISFFYHNVIVRYIEREKYIDNIWKNLRKLSYLIYETDFLERFNINSVSSVLDGYSGNNMMLMHCTSRQFCNLKYDPENKFFNELLQEFGDKYGIDNVSDIISRDIGIGFIEIAMDLRRENNEIYSYFDTFAAFDTYEDFKYGSCKIYQKDRQNCCFTQSMRPDNPYGITVKTNPYSRPLPFSTANLIINAHLDIIEKFTCFGPKKFFMETVGMVEISSKISLSMEGTLKALFESKGMQVYRDCLLSSSKKYRVLKDDNEDLWARIEINAVIDPNAFGEENYDKLMEIIHDEFCGYIPNGKFDIIAKNKLRFSFDHIIRWTY